MSLHSNSKTCILQHPPLFKKSTFFLYSWSIGDADDSLLRDMCGEYALPFTSVDAGELDLEKEQEMYISNYRKLLLYEINVDWKLTQLKLMSI